jgi:uncharacterized GH25 family protein
MRVTQLLAVLVALSLVVGSVPAAAMASTASVSTPQLNQVQDETNSTSQSNSTNNTDQSDETNTTNQSDRLRASTGQQLSTVLEVTDDEVTNAIEESSAEAAFASAAETERASLLASRASTLRDRTAELVDDRRAATAAYENGTLSASEYAQRIAVLSGQASTVSVAFDRLDQRAASVPAAELEAAGYDAEANAEAQSRLQSLTGSSARALLSQYTGLTSGEFSVDRADGVSIEVESDDGEQSREFERDQPGDGSFVISQREAVTTAQDALSTDRDGEWTLQSAERDSDGYFELEFGFSGPTHTGEAEVSVDGQTGEIFEFEEELEPRDLDDDDDAEDETSLSITVVSGEPAPGATVTLQVTAAGEPVAGAEVEIDDQIVGTTDDNGQLTVTLPDDDEVDIEVEDGDREGELELSLGADREEADDDDDENDGDESDELSVSVVSGDPAPNATVTIEVTQNDEPVADASVTVNDEPLGVTDENGQLTITLPDDEEVDIEVESGDSEGELDFEFETDEQDREDDADEADDEDEDEDEDDDDDEDVEDEDDDEDVEDEDDEDDN